jgi:hypothetical protein
MWCSNCRQDVPGIAASADGEQGGPLCCLRCGSVMLSAFGGRQLRGSLPEVALSEGETDDEQPADHDPLAALDTWELEEKLKHVKRLVGSTNFTGAGSPLLAGLRIDAAQTRSSVQQAPAETPLRPSDLPAASWGAFFAWAGIALGLAASTCGGVLTAWSFLAPDRHDLRTVGIPALLGGQLLLVLGLVLQLHLAMRDRWRAKAIGAWPAESRAPLSGEPRANSSASDFQ